MYIYLKKRLLILFVNFTKAVILLKTLISIVNNNKKDERTVHVGLCRANAFTLE